jgi:uncharacterized protein
MLRGMYIYDADAHVAASDRMWADLPEHLQVRRPRPARIEDAEGLGGFSSTWFVEGYVTPHPWGPSSQPANTPRGALDAFPGTNENIRVEFGSQDLSRPELRVRDLDRIGIDSSVMYPSTIYATMASDPELEAALYRAYNRHVGKACQTDPKRLKWAGLLPLRHPQEACAAIAEMRELGASAAVVFGTVGDRLLSDPLFTPAFDALTRSGLPLSIHFGMSYPPYWEHSRRMFPGNIIGMSLPVFLAFFAVTGGGLMDRHPSLKIAFLEFGAEWILYMVPRMDHYRDMAVANGLPFAADVPQKRIIEYVQSGNLFISSEAEDHLVPEEMKLVGEDQFLYASDIPHPEMRENAAEIILDRNDLTDAQKRKLLCNNPTRFYGEP